MSSLARAFTKAAYSVSGPSEDEARQAWDDVDVITRALDSKDTFLGRWRRRLNPGTLLGGS
ncbi:MAG TPA: hypothetical protein VI854_04240, partial [Acidimicrobiia bacterium]|nr:hypothetical protein [Acidimicrobiia bacterium]